jgi:hypothetical protein
MLFKWCHLYANNNHDKFYFWGLHPVVLVTKTLLWWPSIATKFLFPLFHSCHYMFQPMRAEYDSIHLKMAHTGRNINRNKVFIPLFHSRHYYGPCGPSSGEYYRIRPAWAETCSGVSKIETLFRFTATII